MSDLYFSQIPFEELTKAATHCFRQRSVEDKSAVVGRSASFTVQIAFTHALHPTRPKQRPLAILPFHPHLEAAQMEPPRTHRPRRRLRLGGDNDFEREVDESQLNFNAVVARPAHQLFRGAVQAAYGLCMGNLCTSSKTSIRA